MIIGSHVGLRGIERDDLAQLLVWRNRPALRHYFREVRELTMAHQTAWYETVILNGAARARMFAIVRLADQALLGVCGLTTLDWLRRSGEISLYIGVDDLYCDRIWAPDALALLTRHGFDDLGLHRLWAEIYAFDAPKKALLEHADFQPEGRLRDHHWADGRFWDSLLYGQLRGETTAV